MLLGFFPMVVHCGAGVAGEDGSSHQLRSHPPGRLNTFLLLISSQENIFTRK